MTDQEYAVLRDSTIAAIAVLAAEIGSPEERRAVARLLTETVARTVLRLRVVEERLDALTAAGIEC